jgi:uncharacterized membrane protein
MDAVFWIGLWAGLFIATHLIVSSSAIRPRLVAAIGALPYRGIYSLISFATFIPLTIVFAHHKHVGPMLWYLRGAAPMRWLAWIMMFAALVVFTASLISPSPSGMGAEMSGAARSPITPRGILKLTRHPGFIGLGLFGIAHLLMNGWLGDVMFFATFPALGIIGGIHQDTRKVRELGDSYRQLIAQTSIFPGAALWDGRQHWTAVDTPWVAAAVGAGLTLLVILLHPMLFGGNPLG